MLQSASLHYAVEVHSHGAVSGSFPITLKVTNPSYALGTPDDFAAEMYNSESHERQVCLVVSFGGAVTLQNHPIEMTAWRTTTQNNNFTIKLDVTTADLTCADSSAWHFIQEWSAPAVYPPTTTFQRLYTGTIRRLRIRMYTPIQNPIGDPKRLYLDAIGLGGTLIPDITPTPTPTVTFTPTPIQWPPNGIIPILPDQVIPLPVNVYTYTCDKAFRQTLDAGLKESRPSCSVDTFRRYFVSSDEVTWLDVISLVIFLEADPILSSPHALGSCYDNPGASANNTYRSDENSCAELKKDFLYAVVEQLHNKCARALRQWDNKYATYKGECSERGIFGSPEHEKYDVELGYLAGIEAWYRDPFLGSGNTNKYRTEALTELVRFAYDPNSTSTPNNPNWGKCPCNWGNVGTKEEAENQSSKNGSLQYSYAYFYYTVNPPEKPYFEVQ